jgi:hypothetical protein
VRVLALVAGLPERDAVLHGLPGFGPPMGAKLAPWTETRVSDCGAGTLVLLPATPSGEPGNGYDAAVAAGVATSRLRPELVLALDVVPDAPEGGRLPADVGGLEVDSWLRREAEVRLSGCEVGGSSAGTVAPGAYAAARVHGRPFLALEVPTVDALSIAVPALLNAELR